MTHGNHSNGISISIDFLPDLFSFSSCWIPYKSIIDFKSNCVLNLLEEMEGVWLQVNQVPFNNLTNWSFKLSWVQISNLRPFTGDELSFCISLWCVSLILQADFHEDFMWTSDMSSTWWLFFQNWTLRGKHHDFVSRALWTRDLLIFDFTYFKNSKCTSDIWLQGITVDKNSRFFHAWCIRLRSTSA